MSDPHSAARTQSDEIIFKKPGDDAAYDAWFQEQVQIGLDAVRRGETAAHEAVRARWQKKRAELLRRVRQA